MVKEQGAADYQPDQSVDLTNCDREPIHIPSSIQPHGLLFVLQEPDLTILQVSANSAVLTGFSPQQLLNQSLNTVLEPASFEYLENCLQRERLENNPLYLLTVKIKGCDQTFDGIVHRNQGLTIMELEPSAFVKAGEAPNIYNRVRAALARLTGTISLQTFCQAVAEQVRELTGFDRVMIYRFDEDGKGQVFAEAKLEKLTSYLGLHYPASDIPKQARALYLLNWLRLIADVTYTPAPLVPSLNSLTGQPLDMSYTVLRSVSPIHIEYLKNMGVGASMSISLVKDNQLWGLIACHHESAKFVPYEIRTACELIGQIVSLQLTTREEKADFEYKMKLKTRHAQLLENMSKEEYYLDGLIKPAPGILDFIGSGGVALHFDDTLTLLGQTPTPAQCHDLINWLASVNKETLFCSNGLSKEFPPALDYKDVASGLLAVAISPPHQHYILWFRPEVIQTVNWGGNPHKPVETVEGEARLMPRKSFALWQETVALTAYPWLECEIEAALELKNAIGEKLLLRQATELARLNHELEQSNIELDAFSYIASHDLKEPLRGIHNYSSILLADYAEQLDEEGQAKLKTLARLTQRMESLIDSLLYFSRVGRIDFSVEETNLDQVAHEVLDILSARISQSNTQIRLPRSLPVIRCDRVRLGEVFNNLISNALKYNDKPEKWVEIGYRAPGELPFDLSEAENTYLFYVRDNGIGIQPKYFEAIFLIFKRLHGREKYGGGTGTGLTIAKKIIERHGGKIWVESTPGEGSTFYFTLADEGKKL
jgi:light-regulated signal transduction histidine kinase (bacteriophytochrome)